MSILINKKTRVIVQGITGYEAARATTYMHEYGTRVVAGVTPGKGGQTTPEGIPVYDSVDQALARHPDSNLSLIMVPAPFVRDATLEAIQADIPLINIFTEKVPVHDVAYCLAYARSKNIRIIGPSSVGIISPGQSKVGSIGSGELAHMVFSPGPVGVISKSGGMTAEISRLLTTAGLGQSTAIGIGGDIIIGCDFLDLTLLFEKDTQTHAIVIFGEVGGVYEEKLAQALHAGRITKPVIALIAGDFGNLLLPGTVLGHAGAIVSQGRGSAQSKITALKKAGASVVRTPDSLPKLVRQTLAVSIRA